ncbi:replicative DNA helicase [Jiangella endophytica]|uniref:replicative DNA helicase n=1 Tax=Jiangella endophytica TaxID=1623398 RepID=UPI000E3554E8|nr:replicative DNA helicase [Jiangella endophytica]
MYAPSGAEGVCVSVAELPDRREEAPVDYGRTPPQDVAAEQSVLGGMLLSKDAIADVVEIIRGNDFYRPAHEAVYEAVIDLYGRGEPADAVTVAAQLQKRGELGRVGGAPYLHTLVSSVPSAANAGFYAEIVRERAILRRLVEAGTRITQMGYSDDGDADVIVDRAQAEIYAITEKRASEDYHPLSEIMEGTLDEIEAIGSRGGQMVGVPTGFTDLDALTNGLHPGQLVILAARPAVGKSTLGLDLARAASIKHGLTSVVYSLEMGRNEITMRLLSAEAKVPLHHMRSGQMTDDDWNRIARSTGEVSSAPLYIDDSPNMTMMEIRAKCRRLKQRNDLRLVIIDYLQLMSSGKRVESRQQEVAEFSRALKLLAKELEVPVIAMSQLNRGPEQRQDKKPMLSDLRESGCLPASTRILRADTGAEITIGELMASSARDIPVWSLDDSLRYVPRTMTHAFPSGRKETFRLRLASGKQIDATANHPFLTYEGWRPLGEVSVGSRLAVPRHVPAPLLTRQWADAEVVMLAHLIGDGSFVRREPIRYASVDEENLAAVTEAARHFGITAIRDDHAAARVTTLRLPAPYRLTHGRRNPIAAWLDGLGLLGLRSHETFVPDAVFSLPKAQITTFLRHLWATDGSVTVNRNGRSGRLYYASTSRRLLDGVSRLLLRYGISTRLRVATPKAGYRPQYTLDVSGRDEQLRFLREIGCHGARSAGCARLLAVLEPGTSNADVDTVPRGVWQDVRSILAEQGTTHRQLAAATNTQFGGSARWQRAPSRDRLSRVASVLGSAELEMYATNDLLWDEVVAIESLGEQDVYDATVMGTHNFIADGVATHNSIEQDADMVILLHREDAYEKESPRAGEADFIVAKHRNGPTATITVAFQGHYSRFVDMAQ